MKIVAKKIVFGKTALGSFTIDKATSYFLSGKYQKELFLLLSLKFTNFTGSFLIENNEMLDFRGNVPISNPINVQHFSLNRVNFQAKGEKSIRQQLVILSYLEPQYLLVDLDTTENMDHKDIIQRVIETANLPYPVIFFNQSQSSSPPRGVSLGFNELSHEQHVYESNRVEKKIAHLNLFLLDYLRKIRYQAEVIIKEAFSEYKNQKPFRQKNVGKIIFASMMCFVCILSSSAVGLTAYDYSTEALATMAAKTAALTKDGIVKGKVIPDDFPNNNFSEKALQINDLKTNHRLKTYRVFDPSNGCETISFLFDPASSEMFSPTVLTDTDMYIYQGNFVYLNLPLINPEYRPASEGKQVFFVSRQIADRVIAYLGLAPNDYLSVLGFTFRTAINTQSGQMQSEGIITRIIDTTDSKAKYYVDAFGDNFVIANDSSTLSWRGSTIGFELGKGTYANADYLRELESSFPSTSYSYILCGYSGSNYTSDYFLSMQTKKVIFQKDFENSAFLEFASLFIFISSFLISLFMIKKMDSRYKKEYQGKKTTPFFLGILIFISLVGSIIKIIISKLYYGDFLRLMFNNQIGNILSVIFLVNGILLLVLILPNNSSRLVSRGEIRND